MLARDFKYRPENLKTHRIMPSRLGLRAIPDITGRWSRRVLAGGAGLDSLARSLRHGGRGENISRGRATQSVGQPSSATRGCLSDITSHVWHHLLASGRKLENLEPVQRRSAISIANFFFSDLRRKSIHSLFSPVI
jgi:hypothetical protein